MLAPLGNRVRHERADNRQERVLDTFDCVSAFSYGVGVFAVRRGTLRCLPVIRAICGEMKLLQENSLTSLVLCSRSVDGRVASNILS